MKRAIQCLAVLLFAFSVTFGFQVNNASAQIVCELSVNQPPCRATIANNETLIVRFSNLPQIEVVYQNQSGTPSTVLPVIGNDGFPPVNVQPFGIFQQPYSTMGVPSAQFTNVSPTPGTVVVLTVTGR